MLKALRTGPGFRAAVAIAVFAALCLVAPPAVMAFGHGENTAHCLAKADAPDHGMHGTAGDGHGDHGKMPETGAPGCCGLYCLTALPLASGPTLEDFFVASSLSPLANTALPGEYPALLDRPPISLPSV